MSRDQPKPILSHLEELRSRLIWAVAAILVGAIIALVFANPIRELLEQPYREVCSDCRFQVLAATEQFSVLMRIALFGGLVLSSPVVLFLIWGFIYPALTGREKRWVIPLVGSATLLFLGGVWFGFWSLPRGLGFLLNIFADVRTDLRLADYFSFATRFLLAFGISFMYPVFLFLAAAAGAITSQQLARGRRWAVLLIVIAAAIITPTGDALTLLLLSVPLYLFYEVTYWLVRLILRK